MRRSRTLLLVEAGNHEDYPSIIRHPIRASQGQSKVAMNYDLRNSAEDKSQRMLNAIEPGTVMPIHRHQKTSETIACLRGRFVIEFYDELERICSESIELSPNGEVVAINVPAGQWHSLRCLEPNTVLLESKDGPWEPLSEADILKL